jgi:hypothetical protein
LTTYAQFIADPDQYVNCAYDKRYSMIAEKIRLRNLR